MLSSHVEQEDGANTKADRKRKKNMADVRRDLVVGLVRWKIEKRVLERIGAVMRRSDERMTKGRRQWCWAG